MYGLLEPVFKENYAGRAEVLNVFKITKVGQIAGCRVTDGLIRRDSAGPPAPRRRRGLEGQDRLAQALQGRRQRSPLRASSAASISGFKDIKVGDTLESFSSEKVAAELGEVVGAKT